MGKLNFWAVAVSSAVFMGGCGKAPEPSAEVSKAAPVAQAASEENPFLAASVLQYQAPDFSKIKSEHFAPALTEGMRQHALEIVAIAESAEPANFENTMVAMERAGALLTRVSKVFFNLTESTTNDTIQALQADVAPKLAAHQDDILLNGRLFARVEAVYAERETLDPESKRLVERYFDQFVRAGAKLEAAAQARVRAINARQSTLVTQFQNNLLKAGKDDAVVVTDRAELAGISDADLASAAELAKSRGMDGKWVIGLTNTTRQPILSSLENRGLRQRVWESSANRGLKTGDTDSRAIVIELATLRAERAKLLGYDSWAAYVLADQMAKTPEAVSKLLVDMVPKVRQNAQGELAEIQKLIDAEKGGFKAQAWDWEFYAERVRQAKYQMDEAQIRPYFEFERVLKDGVFFTMKELYGITLTERLDLPVYAPDVRAFEVFDADGTSVGLFYADYFARESKRGGAWMDSFVDQTELLAQKPVVVNVLNINKAPSGPTLLSFDDVTTMFHEFGHGVHGLFSKVKYPQLSGTNVPRDFVEFPSQFEEDWAKNPRVIANYAKHYETGEAIAPELLAKVIKSRGFNQGFDTMEYIAAALLDLEWHSLKAGAQPTSVEAFEAAALKKYGVDMPTIPPRYRSSIFAHVFSGGYSAGYYAYMWSEVLAADAFAYMGTQGGLTRENGDKFRAAILSKGATQDPMGLYVGYRGAEPTGAALLARRGLN